MNKYIWVIMECIFRKKNYPNIQWFIIVGFVFFASFAVAQDRKEIPELLQQEKKATDIQLLNIYGKLQLIYAEVNSDSAIYYGDKALALSEKLNQPYYESLLLTLTGYDHVSKGNYSLALDRLLEASRLSDQENIVKNILPTPFIQKFVEDYPDEVRIRILKGYVLNNLGVLYGQTGNIKLEKQALLEAKELVEKDRKDYFLLGGIYNNLAFVYLNQNDLDSAIYYEKMNLIIDDSSSIKLYLGTAYTVLADFYSYQNNLDSAWQYYFKGVDIIKRNNQNIVGLGQAYISMAGLHLQVGNQDSAYFYAREGSTLLKSTAGGDVMSYAYRTLSDVNSFLGRNDSAYHYLGLSVGIRDSLQNVHINNLNRFYDKILEDQMRLKEQENKIKNQRNRIILLSAIGGFIVMVFVALILNRLNRKVKQSNRLLQSTLSDLKSTQALLIQSEKMASLGELTAGIAHEIQNPLNFVNNFSEISNELIEEMNVELDKGDINEAKMIASDVKKNLEKINHHGKRADDIVKGMLQHSRSSSGKMEPADINALCDEYLRLSFHGIRAKDPKGTLHNPFNAKFETNFDKSIGNINIIPQDVGRVLLNLINNAFYAVHEKAKDNIPGFEPNVSISTRLIHSPSGGRGAGAVVEISVADNGNGIPESIKEKIFQPFFTTKPTGQGTGLGLSLSYDIVKAHGGEIKVETKKGVGTTFSIRLPLV